MTVQEAAEAAAIKFAEKLYPKADKYDYQTHSTRGLKLLAEECFEAGAEWQRQQPAMKLVKSSERLPEKEGWLFIKRSTGHPFTIYVVPHAIDKNVWISEGYEWLDEGSQPHTIK